MPRVDSVARSGACGEPVNVRGANERKQMLQTARCREHVTAIHRIPRAGLCPSSSSNRASVATWLPRRMC